MKVLFMAINIACQVLTCCFTLGFAIGTFVIYMENFSTSENIAFCSERTLLTLLIAWSGLDFLSVLFSICIIVSAFFENCLQQPKRRRRRLDDNINQFTSITFLGLKILTFIGSLGILCYLTWLLFVEDCESINNPLFISITIIVVCQWFCIAVLACCLCCSLTGLLGYLIFIGLSATQLDNSRYFSNDDSKTLGASIMEDHNKHEEEKKLLKKEKDYKEKIRKIYDPYQRHYIPGTNIPDPKY